MSRPETLVFVTGTGTEVGKTWFSCRLLSRLRAAGVHVSARKPAQSWDSSDPQAGPLDAELLAGASGEPPEEVCPASRSYGLALAPPMAAAALGLTAPRLSDLVAELSWPADVGVGLVEGAGGVASPLADDGSNLDLIERVAPDLVVLVAHPELGTINDVRLSLAALAARAGPVLVFLNRFRPESDLHRRNRDWLSERDGCSVETDPGSVAAGLLAGSFRGR